MKKQYFLPVMFCFAAMTGCVKNNDSIKEELEKALPTIAVNSLGLMQQVGPFNQSDVIQVTFGGSITNAEPGVLDFAWYTSPSSGAPALADSVHFDSWTVAASNATASNGVSTSFIPSTYPNTRSFSGNLLLKLSKLQTGNRSYSLRVYVRTKDNKVGSVAVTRLITVK